MPIDHVAQVLGGQPALHGEVRGALFGAQDAPRVVLSRSSKTRHARKRTFRRMSDYTLLNLLETEDDAAKHGLGDTLEAHFARTQLGCERTGVSLQRVKARQRMFAHSHQEDEEIYVVLSGGGTAVVGDERHDLRPMDALRVAPQTRRSFEAGPDGLEYLAFGTHHEDDSVMHPESS